MGWHEYNNNASPASFMLKQSVLSHPRKTKNRHRMVNSLLNLSLPAPKGAWQSHCKKARLLPPKQVRGRNDNFLCLFFGGKIIVL